MGSFSEEFRLNVRYCFSTTCKHISFYVEFQIGASKEHDPWENRMKNDIFSVQENRVVVCAYVRAHTRIRETEVGVKFKVLLYWSCFKETEKDGKTTFRNWKELWMCVGGGEGIRVNLLEITKERSLSLGRLSTPCDVILFPILKNIDHFQNVLFKPLLIILKMVFHSIAHGTQFPFSFFSSFFPSCLSAYSVATCLPQSLRMEAMAHRKMTWFMHWAFSECPLVPDPSRGKGDSVIPEITLPVPRAQGQCRRGARRGMLRWTPCGSSRRVLRG